jgi:hypothetical protein
MWGGGCPSVIQSKELGKQERNFINQFFQLFLIKNYVNFLKE